MELETETSGKRAVGTFAEVEAALANLTPSGDSFAILSKTDEDFIQTVFEPEGCLVERFSSGVDSGRVATRIDGDLAIQQQLFDRAEMVGMFRAYFDGAAMPLGVRWEELNIAPGGSRLGFKLLGGLGIAVLTFLVLWLLDA